MTLPTINLAHFRHGSQSERAKFIVDTHDSLMEHGFVKIDGHGIAELFDWVLAR